MATVAEIDAQTDNTKPITSLGLAGSQLQTDVDANTLKETRNGVDDLSIELNGTLLRIKADGVNQFHIGDGELKEVHFDDDVVASAAIKDNAITKSKLADNAVGENEIQLANATYLQSLNFAAATTDVIGLNASDKVVFGSLPQDATVPTVDADLANKKYVDDNSGGGGGGLDSYYIEDFEKTVAVDFTTGNNAFFLGAGAINGTLSDEIVNPISKLSTLKYVQAASSLEDYFASPIIELDEKQANQTTGMTFYADYDGDADDIEFIFYDVTNAAVINPSIKFFESSTGSIRYSFSDFVLDGVTQIRWGAHVRVENIGATLLVDDIEFSLDPFVYKELSNNSGWEDSGTLTIDAVTTAPTKGTIVTDQVWAKRDGTDLLIRVEYRSLQAGASLGVGDYLFKMPTSGKFAGLKIDSTKITYTTTGVIAVEGGVIGHAFINSSNNNAIEGTVIAYDNEHFRIANSANTAPATTNYISAAWFDLQDVTGVGYNFTVRVPIEGWSAESEHIVTPSESNLNSILLEDNGGEAITGLTENVVFNGVANGWNDTNYEYTVEKNNSVVSLTGSTNTTATSFYACQLYVDTGGGFAAYRRIGSNSTGDTTISTFNYVSQKGEFNVGDKLAIRFSTTKTLATSSSFHHLNITETGDANFLAAIPTSNYAEIRHHGTKTIPIGLSDISFTGTQGTSNGIKLDSSTNPQISFTKKSTYRVTFQSRLTADVWMKFGMRTDDNASIVGESVWSGGGTVPYTVSFLVNITDLSQPYKIFSVLSAAQTINAPVPHAANIGDSDTTIICLIDEVR